MTWGLPWNMRHTGLARLVNFPAACLFQVEKIVINLDLKTQISVLFLGKVMLLRVLRIPLPPVTSEYASWPFGMGPSYLVYFHLKTFYGFLDRILTFPGY